MIGRFARPLAAAALLLPVAAGLALSPAGSLPARAAQESAFPAGYEGYDTYAQMVADIDGLIAARPKIVSKQAIGQSYQGRTIWAVKISADVAVDRNEPEVLFESLHHAREHLTVEEALRVIHLLVDNYRANPAKATTELERRVSAIVKSREIWVIPMVNPDGAEYDISDPADGFQRWRKNRQPIPGSSQIGIDLNRNWGFRWGCCGGSSGKPAASTYRGPKPWYAPEVAALRDFVLSRRVDGRQQITESISWHAFNEQVMWPYGYTRADLPRTMTADDLAAFRALGNGVATRNGYTAQQMSDLYILDGGAADWLYGDQRIFALTIEMYPTDGSHVGGFYPPDSVIERETTRNDDAVLYFLEQADCPYRAAGLDDRCGPLNDDFEVARGWKVNPDGSDTATAGAFERGVPAKTRNRAGVKQRRFGYSGREALVTGAAKGASAKANDLDGGTTSAESPAVQLGATGSSGWTLDFRYTFAHNKRSSADDYLRVLVNGSEVFRESGTAANRNAKWTRARIDLDAYAGQSVRVRIEAADGGADSLIEAVVDDIRIYRQS